jgi:hypothetical protein
MAIRDMRLPFYRATISFSTEASTRCIRGQCVQRSGATRGLVHEFIEGIARPVILVELDCAASPLRRAKYTYSRASVIGEYKAMTRWRPNRIRTRASLNRYFAIRSREFGWKYHFSREAQHRRIRASWARKRTGNWSEAIREFSGFKGKGESPLTVRAPRGVAQSLVVECDDVSPLHRRKLSSTASARRRDA